MSLLELHSNLPYFRIAPHIGMSTATKYGMHIECPYCSTRKFTVYQNNSNLEEWYYCSHCKRSGRVISMAAERLGVSEVEAIQLLTAKLEQKVSQKSITEYLQVADLKEAYKKFWNLARHRLLNPEEHEVKYLQHLGWQLRSPMSTERFFSGPAKLYGVANMKEFKRITGYIPKGSRYKPACIVVPLYQTPKYLSDFIFFTPIGTFYTNSHVNNSFVKGDSGFAGIQFLDDFQSDTVVITPMLQNMMQMNMRHFATSLNPLPMLGYYQHDSYRNQKQWSIIEDREIVIWQKNPTPMTLHQAMLSNAKMSFVGPFEKNLAEDEKGTWRKWIKREPTIDIWKKILLHARPYEHAIKNWARVATDKQKVTLLRDCENYNFEVADFVRKEVCPKVSSSVGRRIRVKRTKSDNYTVLVEKNGKWYDRNGRLRFPGVVRVKKIILRPSGKKEYAGEIIVNGKTIEFYTEDESVGLGWVKKKCLENKVLVIDNQYIDKSQTQSLDKINPFDAAMRLEEPEVVIGLERIGWDGYGFQFKNSKIVNGVFIENRQYELPDSTPGPDQICCRLRAEVLSALSQDTKEMEITWAFAAAVCAQITLPAVDMIPCGIAFNSGYNTFSKTMFRKAKIYKSNEEWIHRWPRVVLKLDPKKETNGYFVTCSASPTTLNYTVEVTARDRDLQPRLITKSVDKIILNYLKSFSEKPPEAAMDLQGWVDLTVSRIRSCFDIGTEAFKNFHNRLVVHN